LIDRMGICMDVCTGVRRAFVWAIDRLVDCIGVRTGDRVDVCRAVRRAVRRAARRDNCTAIDRIDGYTADCRTSLVY
jgi:hypothetical protein